MSSPPKTAQNQRKGSALSQTLVTKSKAPICPVQQKQQQSASKSINKSKLDGTFHRLSKPHQIKTTVVPQAATYEKYSVKYFREHPEEDDDLRTTKEKLMDFDDAELDGNDKETFQKLIKQKTLRALEFGDDSKEVADSQIAIGRYYQRTERPQSAIRHYNEGKEIAQKTPLASSKCASIAVGIAESHFSQKGEGKKHISQAAAAMNQKYTSIVPKEGGEEGEEETVEISADEVEIKDESLHFRRDKIRAEIAYEQKDENTCDLYVTAEQTMVDNDLETETEETADFYFKIASVLNENGRTEQIEKYARKAADLYRKLENEEKAKAAEALIPIVPEEEEQKNEEEQKKEEEEKPATEEREINENAAEAKPATEEEEKGENGTRIGSIITDTLDDAADKKEENGESEEKKREAVTFADLPPQ